MTPLETGSQLKANPSFAAVSHSLLHCRGQVTEPTRLAALNSRMEALKRWEASFNEKVKLLKKEEEWFHKQAARNSGS